MGLPGLISGFTGVTVKTDPSQNSLAGRFKVAQKETLFTHTNNSMMNHTMLTKVAGAGTATYDYNTGSVALAVGTASGDKVTRQSYIYMPYLPGSPTRCKATGTFAASKPNCNQRIGIFDDNDGLFFVEDGTGINIVRRSSVTGSPVDEKIPQSSWNYDKLDGNGPSGIVLSTFTNKYLYDIEYLWQGAVGYEARIVIDGKFIKVHDDFTNRPVPFMRTPSLPVRYEIENIGATSSGTTMYETCVDCTAEGGHRLVGSDWTYTTPRAAGTRINVTTTERIVAMLRLRSTFGGKPNRRMLKFLQMNVFALTQSCQFRAAIIHNPTTITGASWTNIDTNHSAAEYSVTAAAPTITGGDQHFFESFTVPAANSRSGQGFAEERFEDTHTIASQNIDSTNSDVFVIYAQSLATNTDVIVSNKFLEFE